MAKNSTNKKDQQPLPVEQEPVKNTKEEVVKEEPVKETVKEETPKAAAKAVASVETKVEGKKPAAPEVKAVKEEGPVVLPQEPPAVRAKVMTRTPVPIRKSPSFLDKDIIEMSRENGTYVIIETVKNEYGKFYRIPADRYIFADRANTVEV